MTNEEFRALPLAKQEARIATALQKLRARLLMEGKSVPFEDNTGVYLIHPDGRREFLFSRSGRNVDVMTQSPPSHSEALFGLATHRAIAETHAMGMPSTHGDDKGVYCLYPDGRKEYIRHYGKNDSG